MVNSGARDRYDPDLDRVTDVEDEKFDRIYPRQIRELSPMFWTPVRIAAEAARFLVTHPETRVLDIGCGAGKFCLVAASEGDGKYTGVEQREHLVSEARRAALRLALQDVEFLHANVTDIAFPDFDAFYIFNPFEENLLQGRKIDVRVQLSPELFKRYTNHVARELGQRSHGTRVVTYMGYGDEVPDCYTCEAALFRDDLKLWIKTREYDPDLERLGLARSRSYRGSQGWVAPRRTP